MDIDRLVKSVLMREVSIYGVSRIPFYFGSSKYSGLDLEKLLKGSEAFSFETLKNMIILKVNPGELNLTPTIRVSYARTGAGRAYYHWLNEEGDSLEAYTLTMRGVTGNILPGSRDAKLKLYTFMKLRELTLEPYWINKEEDGVIRKKRNYQFILVNTIGLGLSVLFIGFYSTPISLVERADSQYNLGWNIEFIVEKMIPDYRELSKIAGGSKLIPDIARKIFGEL